MDARLLIVGDELLADKLDTNGPELGRALLDRGYEVLERLTIGDDLAPLAAALERALSAGGLVVCTGGLGPTDDDRTREAVARATGRELVVDAGTEARLRAWSERLRRPAPGPSTLRQALVPEGARVLENSEGTAPGWVLAHESAVLLVLPGPPRELRALLSAGLDEAGRALEEAGLGRAPAPLAGAELRLTGIGESRVAEELRGLPELEAEGLRIAWLARPGEVKVQLRAASEEQVAAAFAAVRARLGERVFSDDGRSLAEVVVGALREREETVGTVESCTGGLVAGALTSVPGSSAVVRAGLVTYANEAKVGLAGVPPELLEAEGAVSRATAEALAANGQRVVRADWALAVTGIAGPGGGSEEKPVGTVWTAVAGPDGLVEARHHLFPGSREVVRALSVAAVLDELRLRLLR